MAICAVPYTNRKKEADKFRNTAPAYQHGMSEADYNLRLKRDAETRALLAKLMDDNQVDAIAYPLQKRLVVSLPETGPGRADWHSGLCHRLSSGHGGGGLLGAELQCADREYLETSTFSGVPRARPSFCHSRTPSSGRRIFAFHPKAGRRCLPRGDAKSAARVAADILQRLAFSPQTGTSIIDIPHALKIPAIIGNCWIKGTDSSNFTDLLIPNAGSSARAPNPGFAERNLELSAAEPLREAWAEWPVASRLMH